jgi:hypothetical protein
VASALRRWAYRLALAGLATIGVVAILWLAAALALQLPPVQDRLRREVEAAAARLGRAVSVGSFRLSPTFTFLELEEVQFARGTTFQEGGVVTIARLRLYADLRALFRGVLLIKTVTAESVESTGRIGELDLPTLAALIRYDFGPVRLRLLQVRRAALNLTGDDRTVRASGLDFDLTLEGEGRSRLVLRLPRLETTRGDRQFVLEEVSGRVQTVGETMTIEEAGARFLGGRLEVKGAVTRLESEPTLHLRAEGRGRLEALAAFWGWPGRWDGALSFQGDLSGGLWSPAVEGTVEFADGHLFGFAVGSGRGTVRAADGGVRLEEVTLAALDGRARGTLTFPAEAGGGTAIRLAADGLSLPGFMAGVGWRVQATGVVAGEATLTLRAEGSTGRLDVTVADLAPAERSGAGGTAAAALRLEGKVVVVERFVLRLPQTNLVVGGRSEGGRYDLTLDGRLGDVGEVALLFGLPRYGGRALLRGRLTGPVAGPQVSATLTWDRPLLHGASLDRIVATVEGEGATLKSVRLRAVRGETEGEFAGRMAVVDREEGEGRDLTVDLTGRVRRGRLEDLVALVVSRPLPLRGALSAEAHLSGPVRALRGEGQLRLTRPFFGREGWEGAELTFALEPRLLRVSRVRAWRGSEEVVGEVALNFDGRYRFALTATPVPLGRFSAFVGVPMEGTGALMARGEGHLERPALRAEVLLQGLAVAGVPLGTATADLRLAEGKWHLEAGFANPQVRMVAAVDPDPGRPYRLQARFTETELTPLLRRLAPDALRATTAAATGSLTLEGVAEEGAPRRGSLDLSALRVTVQGEPWTASPPVRLRYADGVLEIAELRLGREGGFFTANGRLSPGKRWDVHLDGVIPLAMLTPLVPAADRLTGSGEVALEVTGPWEAPAVEGQMDVRDASLLLLGYPEPFEGIAGEVRFTNGTIQSRLRGRLGEGRLTADAEVRRLNGRWAVEWSFALAAAEAERVLRVQGTERGRISGKLNADGSLSAEAAGAPQFWRSLGGRLNLQVLGGQVRRFRTLAKILGFLNLADLFEVPEGPDRADRAWPYTQITGTFALDRGVARTQDLFLDSTRIKVAAAGGIDLADETLDLTLAVQPLQGLDAVLAKIPVAGYILTGKEGRFVTVYVGAKGSIDDPQIRSETLTTLARGLSSLFERFLGVPGQFLPAPR